VIPEVILSEKYYINMGKMVYLLKFVQACIGMQVRAAVVYQLAGCKVCSICVVLYWYSSREFNEICCLHLVMKNTQICTLYVGSVMEMLLLLLRNIGDDS
jgi:hypothetical protein